MGIPFYFKHLITRSPHILTPLEAFGPCDRLFLDFNCIIHQCAASVTVPPELGEEVLAHAIVSKCIQQVESMIDLVKPRRELIIAVDGVCPYAKMIQQRNRRYLAMWRAKKASSQTNVSLWNSNCATPGTTFMNTLDANLHAHTWPKNIKVTVSDSSCQGEGEHKIFEMIHQTLDPAKKTMDIVYGLDADLILRAMISRNAENIILMRESHVVDLKMAQTTPYVGLHVNRLCDALYHNVVDSYALTSHVFNRRRFLLDYAMLMTLLGNDFVPALTYLRIKDGGIHNLVNAYMTVYGEINTHLILEEDREHPIHTLFLSLLLKYLSKQESANIQACIDQHQRKRPPPPSPTCRDTALDYFPLFHKPPIHINTQDPQWKVQYYTYFHRVPSEQVALATRHICRDYFAGLLWVHSYYVRFEVDMFWAYEHTYSPTIDDLASYVSLNHEFAVKETKLVASSRDPPEINSEMQLLMVLPSCNAHLLPAHLRSIMTDIRLGCVQYYPTEFQLETALRTYLWECRARLPPFSLPHLYRVYKAQSFNGS